jgi:hypothetical protein
MPAVAAGHVVAGLLVLDPHSTFWALLDAAGLRVFWKPFGLHTGFIRVEAAMVVVYPFCFAANASCCAALTMSNSVPGMMVVEFLIRYKSAAVVIDAVNSQHP